MIFSASISISSILSSLLAIRPLTLLAAVSTRVMQSCLNRLFVRSYKDRSPISSRHAVRTTSALLTLHRNHSSWYMILQHVTGHCTSQRLLASSRCVSSSTLCENKAFMNSGQQLIAMYPASSRKSSRKPSRKPSREPSQLGSMIGRLTDLLV